MIADGSTQLLQTGKVAAISAGSISVTSDDGYTKTYTIDSSTQSSDIQTGDEVTVIAKESDNTAVSVTEAPTGQSTSDGTGS